MSKKEHIKSTIQWFLVFLGAVVFAIAPRSDEAPASFARSSQAPTVINVYNR